MHSSLGLSGVGHLEQAHEEVRHLGRGCRFPGGRGLRTAGIRHHFSQGVLQRFQRDLEKGETQLMLTADGQLVEVSKELIKNAKRKSARSNKSLWSWLQKHKEEKK